MTGLSTSPPRPTRLVVVVPAIAGGFTAWKPLLDKLKAEPALQGSKWLEWDHECGFSSRKDASSVALRLSAAIHAEWIANKGFEDIILVGHSLGGLLVRSGYLIACGCGEIARPRADWVDQVSRIILLAAVNRGADPKVRLDVRIAAILGRLFPPLQKLLLWQILRGSSFITNLRIEWIRYFASSPERKPVVVQLVGTEDSLVTREDSVDIEQFSDSYIIDVPGATHEDLYQLEGVANPELRYALLRDAFVNTRPESGQDRRFEGPDRVVMIMHGIRANNKTWVKKTKDAIKAKWPSVEAIGPEHEFLSALRFAFPITRRRHLRWFQDAYAEALAHNPAAKFSFIGHSNGTYLFGESLQAIPGMRFERAALLGSVLPRDFDWDTLHGRKQIAELRVDASNRDWPVGLLCSALRGFGMRDVGTGGFLGFTRFEPKQQVFWHKGGHSAPTEDSNLPGLAMFAVEGEVVHPAQDRVGQEIRWFAGLGRWMVVLGPLFVLAIVAALVYSVFYESPSVAISALATAVLLLAFLEFS